MNILITGGSGFIGSSLIKNLFNNTKYTIINLDKLTYASLYKLPQNIIKGFSQLRLYRFETKN